MSSYSVLFLLVLATTLGVCKAYEDKFTPLVHTGLGWVRGQFNTSRAGRPIVEFLGIRYGKATNGSLRFQSPQCPDRWSGVYDATKECSDCVQQYTLIEAAQKVVTGSEDCLCLNVFTPNLSLTAKMPVLLWIHGGAYVGGSGAKLLYGPELLLDRDVVLVTMNYRLGIMGFLSTGDSIIPGNFGMKDQALALRWVKENIANFGGDPDSITLFGESAGAVSVNLHQFSPLSEGLFHKAIQHSGSLYNPWGFTSPEVIQGRTASLAEMVGCPSSPSETLLECLQALQPEVIVNATHKFLIWGSDPIASWTPTVEHISVVDAFLTEDPRTSTKELTIPLLTGFNNAEGGLKTIPIVGGRNAKENMARWNKEFDTLTPAGFIYNNTELDKPEFTQAIRRFYFGSETKPIKPTMLKEITELAGDVSITMGVLESAEKHKGPTFLYYYNYNKTFSMCPLVILGADKPYVGACHYDELNSFFPLQGTAPKYDPSNKDPDYLLSVDVVEMWENFAKTGNPSTSKVTWGPVKSDALEFLSIGKTGYSMQTNPLKERREFWKKLKSSVKTGDLSWLPAAEASTGKSEAKPTMVEVDSEESKEDNKKDGLVTSVVKTVKNTLKKTTSLLGGLL